MNKDTTYELKIEKIVPKGLGMGFAEKMTFFVPLAAKGDLLKVKINQLKGKIAFAEIVEIIEPSTDRTAPKCEYFGRCGGCDFQHLNYAAQLAAKVGMIEDCLQRIGKVKYNSEIKVIESPNEYGYRARAAWHLDTRKRKFGYFRRGSHDIIDVKTCPILTDELQQTLMDLRGEVEWGNLWSNRVEVEAASAGGEESVFSDEIIEPTNEIFFTANGEKYIYSAHCFFQANSLLIEKLIETAISNSSGENALDLYCGVGLFTLPLARKFTKVGGVEGNPKAIEYAQQNLENARIENAKVFTEAVGDWLADNKNELKNIDLILLDPPRTGAEPETIKHILEIKPKEISYVSCEPSVLARDLRILIDGGYNIESITAIDLFPQTHHIETVVRLNLQT